MSGLFVFLFLFALILLPVSLIKPSIFNHFAKNNFSRKQLGLIFGSLIIASLILIGITAPPTSKQEPQVKGDKTQQQTEATGELPEVSPDQVEIATPTPSPSPTLTPTPLSTPTTAPKLSTPTPGPKVTAPTQTPQTNSNCDPSYPSVCIAPPPPDLDCNQIPYRRFKVLSPDPHRFDGDNDGIGCES